MRLELKVRRGQWSFFAALLLLLGTPFALAAPLFLLVAVVDHNGGALVGMVLGALFGFTMVPAGLAAWPIYRSHPAIVVSSAGLKIEHSGVFVTPVELDRSAVHSVYVRRFQALERPPKFEGTAGQRLRQ